MVIKKRNMALRFMTVCLGILLMIPAFVACRVIVFKSQIMAYLLQESIMFILNIEKMAQRMVVMIHYNLKYDLNKYQNKIKIMEGFRLPFFYLSFNKFFHL